MLGGPLVDLDALDASQSKAKDRPWAAVPRNVAGFRYLGLLASMMSQNSPLGVGFPIIIAAQAAAVAHAHEARKARETALLDRVGYPVAHKNVDIQP